MHISSESNIWRGIGGGLILGLTTSTYMALTGRITGTIR